jgi:DNA polymerase-3 subunit epsilon
MLSKPIEEVTFAFLDIETTGLSAEKGARVCEVAVVKNMGGKSGESFSRLVNPLCPIPPQVSMIHKITDDMVAGEPHFEKVAPVLASVLEDCAVVCHNADFDVKFLSYEFQRIGLRFPDVPVLDTLKFARRHGGFESNRRGNIAQALGYGTEGWHRALADVKMTEYVFLHFVNRFRELGARTLSDLSRLQTVSSAAFKNQHS